MKRLYSQKANQRKLETQQEARMDGIIFYKDEPKPGRKTEILHPG
jgi:hypothetical protein